MSVITIKPNQTKKISVAGSWLVLHNATGDIEINSSRGNLRLRPGKAVNIEGITEVMVRNLESRDVDADFEDTNYDVRSMGDTGVNVTNDISVQRIVEPINVLAQATVDGGEVYDITPKILTTETDVSVAPGQTVQLTDANHAMREIVLQLVGNERGVVRVGDSNVSESAGTVLVGSIAAPNTVVLTSAAPLYAKNVGDKATKISLNCLKHIKGIG